MLPMMRLRFPIPAKLFVGFLANLALLALGFWLVFRAQFGTASSQLFAGIAEPRVQALAERLGGELRTQPRAMWGRLLEGHTKALGVQFAIYDGELRQVAGKRLHLPADLVMKVREELAPHTLNRPEDHRGPPQGGPPPFDDIFGFAPPPDDRPPPRGGPPDRGREPPPMDPDLTSYPKVAARTQDPTAYWVVSRVPTIQSERGWLPQLLVMRSDTLTAGGLFFDPKPWLYAGAGVLLISGLIWVPLALGLTRSLWRIRTATGRIAEGDFAVAVPDAGRGDELGELGRSVQQMAQRLHDHVSGQKRFLGDIAHELCSPIARMQASLGILEHAAGDEKQQRYLQKVSGELQHMSALVNELLSFSKASLKREVTLQPVALAPLVRDVLEREGVDAAACHAEVPASLRVQADAGLLGRAVGNLVRNALRHAAGSGPVELHARTSNGHVMLSVRDHGPGVPEEALPKLFDPFYRTDAARSRETGGVGLGLAIVKSGIEACGGGVTARNVPGGGLEVTLSLVKA